MGIEVDTYISSLAYGLHQILAPNWLDSVINLQHSLRKYFNTLSRLTVQSFAMAKEKSTDKEERKKEKHAKKAKRSEKDGVHKSKKDKKGKHREAPVKDEDVEEVTEIVVDANMTEALLHKLENQDPKHDVQVVTAEDAPSEPVLLGALVPFANPLADEKTQKKVLKSIKKGLLLYYGVSHFHRPASSQTRIANVSVLSHLVLQRPKIDVSSVASKKSSSPSGNLPQQRHQQAANHHILLFSQPIFLRWM